MPSTSARNRVEAITLIAVLLASPLFAQQLTPPPVQPGSDGSVSVRTQGLPAAPKVDGPIVPKPYQVSGSPSPEMREPRVEEIQQSTFQEPPARGGESAQAAAVRDITIQLDPPSFLKLTGKLDSEAMLQRRILQEAKNRGEPGGIAFPEEPVLSTGTYQGRHWPQMVCSAEPNYVGYNRLLFQQINLERYGWDLGAVTPVVSAAIFFKDVLFLPYHLCTDPFRLYEYNTGYCLPGDPVPLLLYPPEVSFTGALGEMGAIVLLVAVFP